MNPQQQYWVDIGPKYPARFERQRGRKAAIYFQQEQAVLSLVAGLDPPPRTVLEIGCGFGRYTRKIYPLLHPIEYLAVDISSDQIQLCRKDTCRDFPVIHYEVCCAEDFLDGYVHHFDLVFSAECLMHLPPRSAHNAYVNMLRLGTDIIHVDLAPKPSGKYWGRKSRRYLSFAHPYEQWLSGVRYERIMPDCTVESRAPVCRIQELERQHLIHVSWRGAPRDDPHP